MTLLIFMLSEVHIGITSVLMVDFKKSSFSHDAYSYVSLVVIDLWLQVAFLMFLLMYKTN